MTPQIPFPMLAAPRAVGIAAKRTSSRAWPQIIGACVTAALCLPRSCAGFCLNLTPGLYGRGLFIGDRDGY